MNAELARNIQKVWFQNSKLFSPNNLRLATAIITTVENWQS